MHVDIMYLYTASSGKVADSIEQVILVKFGPFLEGDYFTPDVLPVVDTEDDNSQMDVGLHGQNILLETVEEGAKRI